MQETSQKNLKKGVANFVLISLLYIGFPIIFITIIPLFLPSFRVDIGVIIGLFVIGLSNAFSFFLRGYFPAKSMPNILGGLGLCLFSGIFFLYWMVIGSGLEISTDFYTAQADLGIISQIFVWTLIGTSTAFILELFYYYKKFKNYRIVKLTKNGFLIANLVAIGLLIFLIYQMAMTRYSAQVSSVTTNFVNGTKYYKVNAYINLDNHGLLPIEDMWVKISIYIHQSDYYEQGYLIGTNVTRLSNLNGINTHEGFYNAASMLINTSIQITAIQIEILFHGRCFGATMQIICNQISLL